MRDPGRPLNLSLVTLLKEKFNIRARKVTSGPTFSAYSARLSNLLFLSGLDDLLVIEVSPTSTDEDDLRYAYRELVIKSNWRHKIKLLVLPMGGSVLHDRLREVGNTVIVTKDDLSEISDHNSAIAPLRRLLRSQLDTETLNPYQYKGAVTGNKFFGRESQISTIIKHPNRSYLVTGARMSGKTSLLLEAQRQLIDAEYEEGAGECVPPAIYVDCKLSSTVEGLISSILLEMGDHTSFSSSERWKPTSRWRGFFNYLRLQVRQRPDKRLRLFLDEYDTIVALEGPEKTSLTWGFRSLQQSNSSDRGHIQFVMAGSKQLAGLTNNVASPLYNFLNEEGCELSNFNLGTVQRVLESPMADLGIALSDPALVANELLHETAGRPSSVQYVCQHLLDAVQHGQERAITVDMIRHVVQSAGYLKFYRDTLLDNTDDLEGFILCSQSQRTPDESVFSLLDIIKVLKGYGLLVDIAHLNHSLDDLVYSGFLTPASRYSGDGRYEISVPVIRRIYRTIPLHAYLSRLVSKHLAIQLK